MQAVWVGILVAVLVLQSVQPVWANTPTPTDAVTPGGATSDVAATPAPAMPGQAGTPTAPASAAGFDGAHFTYAECDRANVDGVETEMVAIATALLNDTADGIDFEALVARQWHALNMDAVFDGEVGRVAQEVRDEPRSWWDMSLFTTGWVPSQAEDLAERMISDVLTSSAFTAALDELSTELAAELAYEIEIMAARSATSMLLCLQAYVGNAYTENLYTAFAQHTQLAVGDGSLESVEAAPGTSVLEAHGGALAGGGVLILTAVSRQIAQSLGKTLAGRLVGRVVTRIVGRAGAALVPYAGWILGLGLILFDLIAGAEGALPHIESTLRDEEVKVAIRHDIATVLEEGLTGEIDYIARTLATGLLREWDSFCAARDALCTLAAENPGYRNILATTPLAELDRFEALTQTYLDRYGRELLDQAIINGEFYRLATLPPGAVAIFAHTRTVETTLAWVEVARATGVPAGLARIAQLQLHTRFQPDDLTAPELATIITIEDNGVFTKLVDLDVASIQALMALIPGADLADVVAQTATDELYWLTDFLGALDVAEREGYVEQLAAGAVDVARLQELAQATPDMGSTTAGGQSGATLGDTSQGDAASAEGLAEDGMAEAGAAESGQDGDAAPPLAGFGGVLQNVNSILFASLFIFILVVLAGVFIAARQSSSEDVN